MSAIGVAVFQPRMSMNSENSSGPDSALWIGVSASPNCSAMTARVSLPAIGFLGQIQPIANRLLLFTGPSGCAEHHKLCVVLQKVHPRRAVSGVIVVDQMVCAGCHNGEPDSVNEVISDEDYFSVRGVGLIGDGRPIKARDPLIEAGKTEPGVEWKSRCLPRITLKERFEKLHFARFIRRNCLSSHGLSSVEAFTARRAPSVFQINESQATCSRNDPG